MIRPGIDEVRKLAATGMYSVVPVSLEIMSDIKTPIEVLKVLRNVSSHCYMLESVGGDERWGRYTFLGYDPKFEITCVDGHMNIGAHSFDTNDPERFIRQVLDKYKSPKLSYLPSFTGGLVGYFSYDYIKYSEPTLKLIPGDTEGFKDVDLMFFDKVIAFDNFRQKIILIVNMEIQDIEENYNNAVIELKNMHRLLISGKQCNDHTGRLTGEFSYLFDKKQYCEMVEKAKHHIREGDVFQIVLSNRLEAGFEGSLLNTYRMLRTINPSPYMFFFSSSDIEIAGASPETLVKLENGILYTFPLAGTRSRGETETQDKANEESLLSDPKELAEHNMLVDLGRNDIGRISKFGTVQVTKLRSVERYSHVMHIGSTVCGEIRDDKDALDAVSAILPAGTLSGAPKIRACQLINDIESNKRGIYGGAIGYIDFTGSMDKCIAIRIAYKKNGKVFVRSGAGIVADSVPENEYLECINKAAAVVNALKAAGEM